MSFAPIAVTTDTEVTPSFLRHIETQYEQAQAEIGTSLREDSTAPLKAERLSTEPSSANGRFYYNTTSKTMFFYDGLTWNEVE